MIIDFHTHVFSPRVREDRESYIARDPSFGSLYGRKEATLATAGELIAAMDAAGVAVSVIANFGWATHELCVETNDYIMESVARYPARLVGFGAVQPRDPETALAEVERCARAGLKGIGEMRPDTQGIDPEADYMVPFVQAMTRNRLILLTHSSEPVGHSYPGKGSVTPGRLYPLITRFPELTVVCAHWGGGLPFYGLMPEVRKALANVYFDTAASPFLYGKQVYALVADIVGAGKVIFGSDYPLMPQARPIREIRSLGLPEETEDMILSGNARKLLGLGEV